MQQYPVPQEISNYEFKLVGDMTLKQFFQLAAGVLIALLFYASPLPWWLKWPGVTIFGALGFALAFLPIKGRPLSIWFLAFIKAVYSPTLYTYDKNGVENVFAVGAAAVLPEKMVTPEGEKKTTEYLSTLPDQGIHESLEAAEKSFVQRIGALFHTTHAPTNGAVATVNTTQPVVNTAPAKSVMLETEFKIPENKAVKVEKPTLPQPAVQTVNVPKQKLESAFSNTGQASAPSQQATFTPEAAPPAPPEIPNTIVGQVVTNEGKMVEGAILEIKDSSNKPMRALRTNKVGHFITATPLRSGDYYVETEKEGLTFDPVSFKAEGGLIPPILIRAKAL